MRLWSLHPQYLDRQGLLALWREALLAKKVLEGKTKGYKNHPQLFRFKKTKNPLKAINAYLFYILKEAEKRGYKFSKNKIKKDITKVKIPITDGQLKYEFNHLLKKLKKRDFLKYQKIKRINKITPHPIFLVKKGPTAFWEKIKAIEN